MGLFGLLVLLSVLIRISGRAGFARFLSGTAIVIVLLASLPQLAAMLAGYIERKHPPVPISALPDSEVVVMLGGTLALPADPRTRAELVDSSDRILHTYRIVRQGKAKRAFLVGGNVFDGYVSGSESEYSRLMLREWGLPDSRIAVGERSRTTWQNALEARDWLAEKGWINSPVILVTSALHMPRAVETFRAAGVQVIPATTDIQVTASTEPAFFAWLPSVSALGLTTRAWHELVGLQYYRWRGWAEKR